MQFKVSIHCGQVNTFQFEDSPDKIVLLSKYSQEIYNQSQMKRLFPFGDLLINPDMISFVVVEEVQEVKAPTEDVTLEA